MSAKSWDLLFALSRVVPVPMRSTYEPVCSGDFETRGWVCHHPPRTTVWLQWRGRVLWERTRAA